MLKYEEEHIWVRHGLFVFLIKCSPSLDGLLACPPRYDETSYDPKEDINKQSQGGNNFKKRLNMIVEHDSLLSKSRKTRSCVILHWVMSLYEVMSFLITSRSSCVSASVFYEQTVRATRHCPGQTWRASMCPVLHIKLSEQLWLTWRKQCSWSSIQAHHAFIWVHQCHLLSRPSAMALWTLKNNTTLGSQMATELAAKAVTDMI